MRYIIALILFLISLYFHLVLNFYGNGWQYVQPFLISLLLIYFNISELWLVYLFAFLAGVLLDSISALFGFNTIIFISVIFILKNLQLTTFTSKHIFTILSLTFFSFLFYWLLIFLAHSLFNVSTYYIDLVSIWPILKGMIVNILIVIFLHVWHYNFWVKKHEKQSF